MKAVRRSDKQRAIHAATTASTTDGTRWSALSNLLAARTSERVVACPGSVPRQSLCDHAGKPCRDLRAWRLSKGGTVLDPFGGAGTTGLVADRSSATQSWSSLTLNMRPSHSVGLAKTAACSPKCSQHDPSPTRLDQRETAAHPRRPSRPSAHGRIRTRLTPLSELRPQPRSSDQTASTLECAGRGTDQRLSSCHSHRQA
jgi:hypothetical protein